MKLAVVLFLVAHAAGQALKKYPPSGSTFSTDVDHFNWYSEVDAQGHSKVFDLRVLEYRKMWERGSNGSTGGCNAGPVLLYMGGEGMIEDFYDNTGAMFEFAETTNATVVFLEHRYYGQSFPFGKTDSFTPRNVSYLTIEQAMADFAQFLPHYQTAIGCGGDPRPVILFGGSYGGGAIRVTSARPHTLSHARAHARAHARTHALTHFW